MYKAFDEESRYHAFISYRHVEPDRHWAKWLHTTLESYRVPRLLRSHNGDRGRIGRVFRDEEELPASADLSHEIETALHDSRYLIVICSPRTPESEWVNREVVRFRELHRADRILALLIEGDPRDAFPRALREIRRTITDDHGVASVQIEEVEPLAADVRPERTESRREVRRLATLRIMACILQCSFDDLRRRDSERRNRFLLATGVVLTAVAITITALTSYALVQRAEAVVARAKANREQAKSEQAEQKSRSAAELARSQTKTADTVAQLLMDMFATPTPYEFLGVGVRLGSHEFNAATSVMLERGAEELNRLSDQPVVQAALMAAIARAYSGIGALEKAMPLLEKSLAIRRRELPPNDPRVADSIQELSQAYFQQGRTAEAEQLGRDNLRIRRALGDEDSESVARAKANLALFLGLSGDGVAEAEQLWRETLTARRNAFDKNDPRVAEALIGLAGVLLWGPEVGGTFRPLEAAPLFAEGVHIFNAHEATRPVGQAITAFQQAIIVRRLGNAGSGAKAYRVAMDLMGKALGTTHPLAIYVAHDYADCLYEADERAEAQAVYNSLFDYYREHGIAFVSAGIESKTIRQFSALLVEAGERDRLVEILRQVLARQRGLTSLRGQNDAFIVAQLAAVLNDAGKADESRTVIEDYLSLSNVLKEPLIVGNRHQRDAVVRLLKSIGRSEDALELSDQCLATLRSTNRPQSPALEPAIVDRK